MSNVFRSIPIVLFLLALSASVQPALAGWTRVSGPVPPPVAAFSEHDGRWFMGTNFADSGDLFVSTVVVQRFYRRPFVTRTQ